ncbi:hypothetical protein SUGI_1110770 [Cryptomeria japonica]|nr:hypothetical protein SUGI_1110770 [Cryptomeria japonica]
MSDPFTLCTGITYDRASIKKWFRAGNNICPASGQTLHTRELIPNHTLAALIKKWRLKNPSDPTAQNNQKLQHMIEQIDKGGAVKIEALRNLKNFARDESNRSNLQSEGVLPALIRVMQVFDPVHPVEHETEAVQEAISAIVLFSVDEDIFSRDLLSGRVIRTVEWVLAKGDLESRINAATRVEKLAKGDETGAMEIGSMEGITDGLLTLLEQNNNTHYSGLRALVPLSSGCISGEASGDIWYNSSSDSIAWRFRERCDRIIHGYSGGAFNCLSRAMGHNRLRTCSAYNR